MRLHVLTSILFVFAACDDGNALSPGAGDDPGEGTSTLFVEGRVSAESRIANARVAAEFDTDYSFRVTLNQQPVTTGTVKVITNSGELLLTYNGDGENRWFGRGNGYEEVYLIEIESGPDKVTGVRIDGPDIHSFSKPLAGATVDTTMPLEIGWSCDDTADTASIETERIDRVSIPDSGKYMLAAGALKADQQEARTNRITIQRSDIVIPAGAVPGSELSVRVTNDIEVVAQPNPAL